MYNCINDIIKIKIKNEKLYSINNICISIYIGKSRSNIKKINLYYFNFTNYSINIRKHDKLDNFELKIKDNFLIITRTDSDNGWNYKHYVDIIINYEQNIYLFTENYGETNKSITKKQFRDARLQTYVTYNSNIILNGRNIDYYNCKMNNLIF